jgi:hypothetical protein
MELAGRIARDRGEVVSVGLTGMAIPRELYYRKELSVKLSRSYGPGRYDPDYEEKGLLPFQLRNYGRNAAVLKKFLGSKLVGAGVPVLEMTFKGLEDWAVVDIWIKGEDNRDIRRSVLYILHENAWKVVDSGRLVD